MDSGTEIPKCWSKLSERLVADCRVFRVMAETFRHPDGRCSEFFVNDSPDWVQCAAIVKMENGKLGVVMETQFRFGSEKLSLEFPGGIVEAAETPVEAAERELREETGYAGRNARLVASYSPNPAVQNNKAHFVMLEGCKKVSGLNWDENEEISVGIVPVEELDRLVQEGKIFHSIAINSVYFLKRELSKRPCQRTESSFGGAVSEKERADLGNTGGAPCL